jgi:hypothetical protein
MSKTALFQTFNTLALLLPLVVGLYRIGQALDFGSTVTDTDRALASYVGFASAIMLDLLALCIKPGNTIPSQENIHEPTQQLPEAAYPGSFGGALASGLELSLGRECGRAPCELLADGHCPDPRQDSLFDPHRLARERRDP